MPDRKTVDAFIAAFVNGDHVQAILNWYHEDATMRENLAPPRRGREALVAHEAAALARMKSMTTHPPFLVVCDVDDVVIGWTFDMTDGVGVVRRLEEISVQKWRGDRIAAEQFFYDTATAWRPSNA